jgi:hypothetical protein
LTACLSKESLEVLAVSRYRERGCSYVGFSQLIVALLQHLCGRLTEPFPLLCRVLVWFWVWPAPSSYCVVCCNVGMGRGGRNRKAENRPRRLALAIALSDRVASRVLNFRTAYVSRNFEDPLATCVRCSLLRCRMSASCALRLSV